MKHRDDIDGLRAVAVLSVVIYHFAITRVIDGGFIGVDVFFVISGYLITGIVQRDIDGERFSLAQFYNRRVRRIFPALFVVYLFCAAAASALLFPREAIDANKEILASLGFVSNLLFYSSTSYFDQTKKLAPLLHTWSLSVEEQFYIVLPLLLFGLRKITPRARTLALLALTVLSFAAAVWMVQVEAPRAFYLVQYRGWELLFGSLLALRSFPAIPRRGTAELLGALGLALVALSALALRSTTPFPGLAALPACLGTAAVIYSGEEFRTTISRLLGWKPLRFVGLVSYSFYLWHWPVLTFYRLNRVSVGRPERLALLAVTFAIAVVSWRYVEQPLRRKPYRFSPKGTLAVAGASGIAMAVLAFGVPRIVGRLFPAPPRVDALLDYLKYDPKASMRDGTCFLSSVSNDLSLERDACLHERADTKNYLLMGDSHAAHLWPGFETLPVNVNVLQATASGCVPVRHATGEKRCTNLFAFLFDEFLPKHHLDAIIVSGRWRKVDIQPLESTVEYIRPFADRVIVLGPIVEYDESLPRLLAYSIYRGDPGLLKKHREPGPEATDKMMAQRLKLPIEYYSVQQAICPNGQCTVWATDDVPLQFDYGHLTPEGAKLVVQRLSPQLFGPRPSSRAASANDGREHADFL